MTPAESSAEAWAHLARQPGPVRVAAATVFGDRLPVAERYAMLLATQGVVRGLIGPREAPRIWQRHLLNCAVVGELVSPRAAVIDVGSGAGLPGIVLAVARPDLTVTLLEPMLRRVTFLNEVVGALDLARRVRVVRGRAQEVVGHLKEAEVVTARALASLDRLAAWCLPLVAPGGRVLALKGTAAGDEVATHAAAVRRLGGVEPSIYQCGAGLVDPPTVVVEIERSKASPTPPTP